MRSERGWKLDTRDGDILSGIVVAVFAAVIFWQASALPSGAGSFPRGIALALGLGGALLVLRSLKMPRTGKIIAEGYSWSLFGIAVVLWGLTVWLVRPFGFFVAAPVFLALMSWIMAGMPRTIRDALQAVVFGAVMSAGIWVIFVRVLGVSLP